MTNYDGRLGGHALPCRLTWCQRRLCKAARRGWSDGQIPWLHASPNGRGFQARGEADAYMRGFRQGRALNEKETTS